jgi:hypothetical protein
MKKLLLLLFIIVSSCESERIMTMSLDELNDYKIEIKSQLTDPIDANLYSDYVLTLFLTNPNPNFESIESVFEEYDVLYNRWEKLHIKTSSSPQVDSSQDSDSNIPDGVSPSCFCMDALSGANLFKPNSTQIQQCRRMYICFENAQADCLLGSDNVWRECL